MHKVYKISLGAVILSMWILPAVADIEALVAAIDPERKNGEQAQTTYETVSAGIEAGNVSVQTLQSGINQGTGLMEQVQNPGALLTEFGTAALTTVGTQVMNGLSEYVNGKESDDEAVEKVEEVYAPPANAPLPELRKHFDEINKKAAEDLAMLFARSRFLRKELKEEEPQNFEDLKGKTISELQKLSKEVKIKSGKRLNKILEMQAYINEFTNSRKMQGFKKEKEETNDQNDQ